MTEKHSFWDDRWKQMWQSYMDFMAKNHRRPSKYKSEERTLVNWVKNSRKLLNKGLLAENRKADFAMLLNECARLQRVNQYRYVDGGATGLATKK